MIGSKTNFVRINNISVLMRMLGLDPPSHPLIALIDYEKVGLDLSDAGTWLMLDFYKITFKKDFDGWVNYGAGTYDFKEGGMAFLEPGQVVQKPGDPNDYQGFALYFHPDLLSGYPLQQSIYKYGFFSYHVSESLFLSEKEKQ
ncbi:MAG: AraC family transcriptional regulator, partial [Chitinophagaceae bacterium]